MDPSIYLYAIFVLGVCLAVALYWIDRTRRHEALFRWSSDNGVKLLSYRQPIVAEASAFPLSLSKSQHVYRIEVETQSGARKSGWLRVGSAWLGLASKAADVKWDAAAD